MKKVSVGDVVNAREALTRILGVAMPAKLAYRFNKIIRASNHVLEDYEKLHTELVKKYGEQVAGDSWKVAEDKLPAFREELVGLLEESADLTFQPIPLSLMDDIDIMVGDMMAMEFIFEEEEVSNGLVPPS